MSEVDRRVELAQRLADVHARIEAACRDAGRVSGKVTLIVVTKTFPAADVALLASLGVRDVAENRHQEAQEKYAACAELGLTWHFVGQLQSNKAAAVSAYCDVVHSVDRTALVPRLSAGADRTGRRVACLVQVNLDEPADRRQRGGTSPHAALEVATAIAAASGLEVRGVMGVAPLGADPVAAFGRLAEVAALIRAEHESATWLSAGMSEDLEAAIRCGATHVRVGSAVLGKRPPLR